MQKEFWRARLMDPNQSFEDEFVKPPQVLFKYIPIRRLDDALPDEKLCSFRATPPNKLNDINEVNYRPTFEDTEDNRRNINQEYAVALTELYPESPISIKDVEEYRHKYPFGFGAELACDQLSRRYGITSFSACYDDIKMWSSYADDCKGVVIGYNVDYWVNHWIGIAVLRKVRYSNKPILVLGPRMINQENAYIFMSDKGIVWKHEQEWRLITELKNARSLSEYPNV